MDSFDSRRLRMQAWVESSTGGPDRHFRSHAFTATTRNLVAVWISEDDGIPLNDGDRASYPFSASATQTAATTASST